MENVKSRFCNILFPAALWSISAHLIPWLVNIWLYGSGGATVDLANLPGSFVFGVLNDFWFLWSIFYCSMITLLINRYFKDSPIAYIAIFLASLFMDDFTFANHKFMFPYFACAYFIGKYDVIHRIRSSKQWKYILGALLIGSGIGWGMLLPMYNRAAFIYTSGNSLRKVERWGFSFEEQMLRIAYRYCIGALGCIFVLTVIYLIHKVIKDGKLNVLLQYLGRKSLAIYCASGLVSGYLYNILLPMIPASDQQMKLYLINLFETVAIILLICMILRPLDKIRLFRKYFMGGR